MAPEGTSLREWLEATRDGKADPPAIMKTLGIKVVSFGEGKASLSMKVDGRFHNPMGTLHGGIMTDIADASMGVALMSTLSGKESFTTLELKMNFLRPVLEGDITADARVVHRGRTVALVESVLKNSEGKEIARGVATQMILR